MAATDIVRISAFQQIPAGKKRARKYVVADLFCGAGGFTSGAVAALHERGATADIVALNHWPVAIDTHSTNHPEAKHFCQDISTVRPHLAVPGGKLDLLLASPACTFHSRASAMRAKTDQQRTDPWHIIPWLSELRVKAFIFENVPEFVKWGPIDPRTGRLGSIVNALLVTTIAFAGLSLYGYTTKRSLSGMGSFLVMGLIGLIVASIVNIFMQSGVLGFAISLIGVLIFAGLTAWDTQRLKEDYSYLSQDGELMQKSSVMGALSLYLNFVNMFQFILALTGSREE